MSIFNQSDWRYVRNLGQEVGASLAADAIGFFFFGLLEGNPFAEGLWKLRYTDRRGADDDAYILASEYLLDREYSIVQSIKERDNEYLIQEMKILEEELQDVLG